MTTKKFPLESQRVLAAQRQERLLRQRKQSRAHRLVGLAVKAGELVKKPCEVCGSQESEAHHDDYDQPLRVSWLCPKHHSGRHMECEVYVAQLVSLTAAELATILGLVDINVLSKRTGIHPSLLRKKANGKVRITGKDEVAIRYVLEILLTEQRTTPTKEG